MSDYYELYQQCKMERDNLQSQLKQKDEALKRARNIIKDLLVDLTDNAHEQAEIYLEKHKEIK